MRSCPSCLLSVALFPALVLAAASAAALDTTRYYPLATGNQWTYNNGSGVTLASSVGGPVVVNGASTLPLSSTRSNDSSTWSVNYTNDASGLRRHRDFIPLLVVPGLGTSSAAGTYTPPVPHLPQDFAVGATYTGAGTGSFTYGTFGTVTLNYTSTSQVIGFETVSNYAGTQSWNAVKVQMAVVVSGRISGVPISYTVASTSWFADGVGTVRHIIPNAAGVTETWQIVSTNVGPGPVPPAGRVPGDYDGDGKADIGIFRPGVSGWYVLKSGSNYNPAQSLSVGWGGSGDVPVPGDYDGDDKTDVAVFRPSNGDWMILKSSLNFDPARVQIVRWGSASDVLVPADYDGDGKTDIAVFRPSNGDWFILKSSLGYDPARPTIIRWGSAEDTPVPGDYDGDGKADLAVFRPWNGAWYILKSSTGYDPAQCLILGWGNNGDVPVPGDYDGDGRTDVAIFRAATGAWYVLKSSTNYNPAQYMIHGWGSVGDTPVQSDYDGDGKTDVAIFRAATGAWYILKSSTGYDPARYQSFGWGSGGDIPVVE